MHTGLDNAGHSSYQCKTLYGPYVQDSIRAIRNTHQYMTQVNNLARKQFVESITRSLGRQRAASSGH